MIEGVERPRGCRRPESSGPTTALVRLAAGGDRPALAHLLHPAQEAAFRFSFMSCGHAEDAKDVMQEPLLTALATLYHVIVFSAGDARVVHTRCGRSAAHLSEANMKTRLHRSRALLRKQLEDI
jgi:DNA-directed RNA polymerase specialized sigma24 family protein